MSKEIKSIKLTEYQKKLLNKKSEKFNSVSHFAEFIGVDRVSLMRIMNVGSGSEKNIKKILEKITNG